VIVDHIGMLLDWYSVAPGTCTLTVAALSVVILAWHELGHVAASVCCGVPCSEYKLGRGPGVRIGRIRGCTIALGIFPVGGRVTCAAEETGPLGRAFVSAGGAIATGLIGIATFVATRGEPVSLPLWLFATGCVFDSAFCISPLWTDGRAVIFNLFDAARHLVGRWA
jgi:hypothetical protein